MYLSHLEYYCIDLQGKINNAKKTGIGGGKEAKLDEIGHKVFDIKVSTNFSSDAVLLNVLNLVAELLTWPSTYIFHINYMDAEVKLITGCGM
jgi:hypothetical protein